MSVQKWHGPRGYDAYDGSYDYTSRAYHKPVTGYHGPVGKPDFSIALLREDGSVEATVTASGTWTDWLDVAKTVYPFADGVLQMPAKNITYTETTPPFNACTFTATEDYVAARFGRKLHTSDKDWLVWHPLAKDAGIPEAYTPTAVHQLVEPYGLAVARIRVRAGKLVLGDTLQMWAMALGCNPFGVVDHTTTNEAAAAQLGMDLALANELFRFEFHERPFPCSIIGEKGWSGGNGVQVGAQGGHARYLAPRGSANDWTISVQLAPVEHVAYNAPLELPPYVRRAGPRTVQLGTAKRPDGTPVAVMVGGKYTDPTQQAVPPEVKTTVVQQPDGSTKTSFALTPSTVQGMLRGNVRKAASKVRCSDCHTPTERDRIESGTICMKCWDDAWTGYACPSCKVTFGMANIAAPILHKVESDEHDKQLGIATLACRKCTFVFQLPIDDAWFKHDPRLVNAIMDTDEYIQWDVSGTLPVPKTPPPEPPPAQSDLTDEALGAEWLAIMQLAADQAPSLEEYMKNRRDAELALTSYRTAQGADSDN